MDKENQPSKVDSLRLAAVMAREDVRKQRGRYVKALERLDTIRTQLSMALDAEGKGKGNAS